MGVMSLGVGKDALKSLSMLMEAMKQTQFKLSVMSYLKKV